MLKIDRQIKSVSDVQPGHLPSDVAESAQPLVLRGFVRHWPVVQAALESHASAVRYLRRFYAGATVNAVELDASAEGRVFYSEDLSGFNFRPVRCRLDAILDKIEELLAAEHPPTVYVGSTTVDNCLPGFRQENDIRIEGAEPLVSIWLGNRSRIAAHYDLPDNIACCASGRRRFTLFPPEQIANLYPGPVDFTPAGQTVSMVDFHVPDFNRFPRFAAALENAQVAELEPGDAVFVPSMWWHHVEGLESLNVLVNYWWRKSPGYMDTPANVLEYALLSLRDLPDEQRRAWHDVFKFYVFEFDQSRIEHIPENRRGILGPMDDTMARKLRARLLKKLNR